MLYLGCFNSSPAVFVKSACDEVLNEGSSNPVNRYTRVYKQLLTSPP